MQKLACSLFLIFFSACFIGSLCAMEPEKYPLEQHPLLQPDVITELGEELGYDIYTILGRSLRSQAGGDPRKLELAQHLINIACDQDDPEALYLCGYKNLAAEKGYLPGCYEYAISSANLRDKYYWLKKIVEQPMRYDVAGMGYDFIKKQEIEERPIPDDLEWNVKASYELGRMCKARCGVPLAQANDEQARAYFSYAAKFGYKPAIDELRNMDSVQVGSSPDATKMPIIYPWMRMGGILPTRSTRELLTPRRSYLSVLLDSEVSKKPTEVETSSSSEKSSEVKQQRQRGAFKSFSVVDRYSFRTIGPEFGQSSSRFEEDKKNRRAQHSAKPSSQVSGPKKETHVLKKVTTERMVPEYSFPYNKIMGRDTKKAVWWAYEYILPFIHDDEALKTFVRNMPTECLSVLENTHADKGDAQATFICGLINYVKFGNTKGVLTYLQPLVDQGDVLSQYFVARVLCDHAAGNDDTLSKVAYYFDNVICALKHRVRSPSNNLHLLQEPCVRVLAKIAHDQLKMCAMQGNSSSICRFLLTLLEDTTSSEKEIADLIQKINQEKSLFDCFSEGLDLGSRLQSCAGQGNKYAYMILGKESFRQANEQSDEREKLLNESIDYLQKAHDLGIDCSKEIFSAAELLNTHYYETGRGELMEKTAALLERFGTPDQACKVLIACLDDRETSAQQVELSLKKLKKHAQISGVDKAQRYLAKLYNEGHTFPSGFICEQDMERSYHYWNTILQRDPNDAHAMYAVGKMMYHHGGMPSIPENDERAYELLHNADQAGCMFDSNDYVCAGILAYQTRHFPEALMLFNKADDTKQEVHWCRGLVLIRDNPDQYHLNTIFDEFEHALSGSIINDPTYVLYDYDFVREFLEPLVAENIRARAVSARLMYVFEKQKIRGAEGLAKTALANLRKAATVGVPSAQSLLGYIYVDSGLPELYLQAVENFISVMGNGATQPWIKAEANSMLNNIAAKIESFETLSDLQKSVVLNVCYALVMFFIDSDENRALALFEQVEDKFCRFCEFITPEIYLRLISLYRLLIDKAQTSPRIAASVVSNYCKREWLDVSIPEIELSQIKRIFDEVLKQHPPRRDKNIDDCLSNACTDLGSLLFSRLQDTANASAYLIKSTELNKNNLRARYNLAQMKLKSRSQQLQSAGVKELYVLADQFSYPKACKDLGLLHLSKGPIITSFKGNRKKGLEYLSQASKQGDTEALMIWLFDMANKSIVKEVQEHLERHRDKLAEEQIIFLDGRLAYLHNDFDKALESYQKLIEGGEERRFNGLGFYLFFTYQCVEIMMMKKNINGMITYLKKYFDLFEQRIAESKEEHFRDTTEASVKKILENLKQSNIPEFKKLASAFTARYLQIKRKQ